MELVWAEPFVEGAGQVVLVGEGHGLPVGREGQVESHDWLISSELARRVEGEAASVDEGK